MSEIVTSNNNGVKKNAGVKKLKRKATTIDLTPMVDLGFLLITFFIFTTTISQARVMKLIVPDDKDPSDKTLTKESGALTLLLSGDNSVYYYEGKLKTNGQNVHRSTVDEIRNVIIQKKRSTSPENLFVIIKPGNKTVYKNIVNLLDEMTINDIKRFALADIETEEKQLMEKMTEAKK